MPQILVTADKPRADGQPAVMFIERVSVSDFESRHFQAQLLERLGWAVGDADAAEQSQPELGDVGEQRHPEPALPPPLMPAAAN